MEVLDNIQYVFIAIIVIFAFFIRKQGVSFVEHRVIPHLASFWIPWLFIVCMVVVSWLCFPWDLIGLSILMFGFVLFMIFKPMNVIHGLIGTRGDIRLFLGMFLFINLCFSCIYYFGFFKDSGITYDLNQPHVEFNIFMGEDRDGFFPEVNKENVPDNSVMSHDRSQCRIIAKPLPASPVHSIHYYHRISYKWVLQNTFLTSLMQEPTDLYTFSCTYTGNHNKADNNKRVANCFNWFLVFHIMISWVLLGVFISLIYQKFRNM